MQQQRRELAARAKTGHDAAPPKADWKLHLPETTLPMRANAVTREPTLRAACTSELYAAQPNTQDRAAMWVLHDGPPYANGPPHLGHALNKVLKDLVNRVEASNGKRVVYVPGWDCHGLPIELKAVQSFRPGTTLTPELVTRVASECAQRELKGQMKEFQSWGVMGDWEGRYETMDPAYERAQLKGFRAMVQNKRIHQGVKPVWWSPATRTALAEAELIYEDAHVSPSVHVTFPLLDVPAGCPELGALLAQGRRVAAVAWTTTPWTLPANRALVVHADLTYVAVEATPAGGVVFVVAEDLLARFTASVFEGQPEAALRVVARFKGRQWVGSSAAHPLVAGQRSPVLAGDFVTTDVGTGIVHAAPGHGQDDYLVCQQAGIAPFSPVDDAGCYDDQVGLAELHGLPVMGEGGQRVVELLSRAGRILLHKPFTHKYPYDWRSKTPVIVRSTRQWFLDSRDLKDAAVEALEHVRFFPPGGKAKMARTVAARMEDWCISRQRYWGVPIPAFYHCDTGAALMNVDTVDALLARMEATKRGVSVWWTSSVAELLPPAMAAQADQWVKGTDTMDVWMDSGLSWAYMAERGLPGPSDMVLEGNDQYRGWFQSSLLTWLAAGNKGAPWKAVAVHGFCLDSNGVKMSKSEGNVIPPAALTHGVATHPGEPLGFEANGVDVMRMWVASHDFTKDISVSRLGVDAVAHHYKKTRNTMRWMLGNLNDFEPSSMTAERAAQMSVLARQLLAFVADTAAAVRADYADLNVASAVKRMTQLVGYFSGLHVEAMKDSLYCDVANDPLRRAYQCALFEVLKLFVCALQPVVPHTMVDVLSHSPAQLGMARLPMLQWSHLSTGDATAPPGWDALCVLRDEVNRLLEAARNDKLIGSPLEARVAFVVAQVGGPVDAALAALGTRESASFFGTVSEVALLREQPGGMGAHCARVAVGAEHVLVAVTPVGQHCSKCPRCRARGAFEANQETMCPRCLAAMK